MNGNKTVGTPPGSDPACPRDIRLTRILCTLISVVVSGLGMMSIVTSFYYGRTSKLGGAEVLLEGRPAVMAGIGMAIFGLFPLALWARTKTVAALWSGGCMIVGLAILLFGR
jgi:hypothetical protein